MNKKGDWDPPRSTPTLILALVMLAMGVIPLLNQFGKISFNLPLTPAGLVLEIILVVGGLWLLISGLMEEDLLKVLSIIVGLVVTLSGALPLLTRFGVLGSVGFISFLYSPWLYSVVGLLLLIGTWAADNI